jgi:putative nucleotidyltransferase with HDIG domain/PAS domain S-box-containing protein
MKSKLAIFVVLTGWLILGVFIFYEAAEYGFENIFKGKERAETFFQFVIFFAFIGANFAGYLINERKKLLVKSQQSEKQLIQAANEWRTTFDSMPYSVMLVDKEFNVIRLNKYTANLFGVSHHIKLMPGKKCYELIHKRDSLIDKCPVAESIKTGAAAVTEYYEAYMNKYFKITCNPVISEGSPVVYVHSMIDITDIKEKENKLIKSKDAFFNMLKDLDSTYRELKDIYNDLVVAFSEIIDAKSPWTKGHSIGVADHAVAIAKQMGLKEKDIETLKIASLLHDIGKIGTYDVILDKPDKLTDDELVLIKKHPAKGAEILKTLKGFENITPIVRSHHEKFDGTGYPDGLKGDEIPFLARIVCVADSFDSMTSDRPYRAPRPMEYAVQELKQCAGTHFDPEIIEAFLQVLTNK